MKTTKISPHKSSIGGIDANWMSLIIIGAEILISFIPFFGWIAWGVPLVIYFMEKKSKFVKYQAAVALIVGIINAVISILFFILLRLVRPRAPRSLADVFDYALGTRSTNLGLITFLGTLETIFSIFFLVIYVIFVVMAVQYKQLELPIIGPLATKASNKLDTIKIGSNDTNEEKKPAKKKKG